MGFHPRPGKTAARMEEVGAADNQWESVTYFHRSTTTESFLMGVLN